MAGEGFMAHAITSLRTNRALLKKRNYKDLKELCQNGTGKTEVEFKKLNAREWAILKQKIRIQHKNNRQTETMIYVLSLALTFIIIFYIYWVFFT
ncbi:hypothetical protein [Zobellia uliginosa]|uniref:hypothetical protein n=1 Tax=Zobellia uliginosa TaxID=143224 RepID=UPI001C06DC79|nr:hypothetical protein [Zobellia uliginosa]MBU2946226.1 hypothetical protein [Zobellia uliginosa]